MYRHTHTCVYDFPPNSKGLGFSPEKRERAGLDGWHADGSWGPVGGTRMGPVACGAGWVDADGSCGSPHTALQSTGSRHRETAGETLKCAELRSETIRAPNTP